MKLKNKVMLITYADSMGKNLKELHTVLNTYYRDAVGGVHILVGAEELLCLRPAGSGNKQLLRLGQNPVPYPELEGLVGLGIRVGQHVQADHPVGQGRLGPVQPHPQQGRQGHPQQQRQLPPAQGLGLRHKTSPSTM